MLFTSSFLLITWLTIFLRIVSGCNVDTKVDEKALNIHKIGSLNLLIFVCLLIVTILTIWLFKKHRVRFIHETGLSIIYGLAIGALIKYTVDTSTVVLNVTTELNTTLEEYNPPDVIRLHLEDSLSNQTSVYRYGYQSKVSHSDLEAKATFDPEIFFNIILPPIIFNAGYQMKRRHFFRNFGAIVTYAFLGTAMSSFLIGGVMYGVCLLFHIQFVCFTDCLLFGTIISATDPVTVLAIFHDLHVDMDLYALVFGESVLNDAVAIVLAETIEDYAGSGDNFDAGSFFKCLGQFIAIFLGSLLLGATLGCVNALMTKLTHIGDFPLLETSLFVLMSYGTFVAAEASKLSGIVAVLFCGICQAHYTFNNLSSESKERTKQIFEMLNFLLENFVFTYIGVATFTFSQHVFNVYFILFAFISILVARAANIYPLTFLVNLGRRQKIAWNFQHMLMYSGLRGAMAFALAMRNTSTKAHQMVLSTTMLIVISTVILLGGFTTQTLQCLNIRVGVTDEAEFEAIRKVEKPAVVTFKSRLADKAKFVRIWYGIDSRLFKPLLTHSRPPLTETLPVCMYRVALLLTSTEQLTQTEVVSSAGQSEDTECVLNDVDDDVTEKSETSQSRGSSSMNDKHEGVGMCEVTLEDGVKS